MPRGLLQAECAVIFNTSNTESNRERTVFGDPLDTIWKQCVFGLCGVPVVYRRMFSIVIAASREERRRWLEEAASVMDLYFPGSEWH